MAEERYFGEGSGRNASSSTGRVILLKHVGCVDKGKRQWPVLCRKYSVMTQKQYKVRNVIKYHKFCTPKC